MVQRYRSKESPPPRRGGDYFPEANERMQFIHTGCALLDCVLGGGWPLGRVANIVGDKSAGKTLLAIEACANFHEQYPKGHIWYREAEAAFDDYYAQKLGLPLERVDFGPDGLDTPWDTVEDIFEDIGKCAKVAIKSGQPGLYIVDSLDALSDRAEQERGVDEGTYGATKAKKLSELFRRQTRLIRQGNVAVLVISQLRDRIGVRFGEKQGRSGGRALDFYSTQILWLHHMATLTQTVKGNKRSWGIRIKAKCKKNKITMPHRECEFVVRFGYGIEDVEASLDWLEKNKALNDLGLKASNVDSYLDQFYDLDKQERMERIAQVREIVMGAWAKSEEGFLPRRGKYT